MITKDEISTDNFHTLSYGMDFCQIRVLLMTFFD